MLRTAIIIMFALLNFGLSIKNIGWTQVQLINAGKGHDYKSLSDEEKEIIKYLNLCRLYPKDFARIELGNYYGIPEKGYDLRKSEYRKSLLSTLQKINPMSPLEVDSILVKDAKCFSKEIGKTGRKGHERFECPSRNSAECISYARETGKGIVLQLLIDHNVKSIGHRKICLDSTYKKIGCSISNHIKFHSCSVIELQRE